MKKPSIGIITVAFGHEQTLGGLLDILSAQMRPGDKLVVVDNHPRHGCTPIAESHPAVSYALKSPNKGFAAGCNLGAATLGSQVDLLLFLNPDTKPAPNSLEQLREASGAGFSAWMPLLLLPDGRVNSAGNVVHTSGLSWCDGYGAPASIYSVPKEIAVVSGACLVVPKSVFDSAGGMAEGYFLYQEDTDFCTRLLLSGHKLGLVPQAHIEHNYDFSKSKTKWLYLERNRLLYIIRTWPAAAIWIFLPQLIAADLGLWAISIAQRRFLLKAKSAFMTLHALPWAIRTRLQIQKTRVISTYEFIETLHPELDSPLTGIANAKLINKFFCSYYKIAKAILRVRRNEAAQPN